MIRPDRISDHLVLRFRVGDVYRDAWIRVYFDRELILEKRKKVMAPGEMEEILLKKDKLIQNPDLKEIVIRIEQDA